MINPKFEKIKTSSDFMRNTIEILPEPDLSKTYNEPPFIDIRKNGPGELDTMESLKEDYIRLQNKIKIMDEIIKKIKNHLYVNIPD